MEYPIKIGILGGGQLGKMLTIAAKKMGFYVVISDPTENSPAGQVADLQIVGDFKDKKTIEKLAAACDVLTYEIELADTAVLEELRNKGKTVFPSPAALAIIQDKLKQKIFLNKNKIPTALFSKVNTKDDVLALAEKFGYPFLLKAKLDAYDGRGNALIKSDKDIDKGLAKLSGHALYVEKFVPFVKEIAVMVARGVDGKVSTFPVVETTHINNICDTVIAPAKISKKTYTSATDLARKIIKKLDGVGVFGVEMFLLKNGDVLINEIAPRVHNSGHYSIEACFTSQFEQHIRAIAGLPLGKSDMLTKSAVMKNILGKKVGSGFPGGIEKALRIDGVSLHMYGKKESRIERKMGHLTAVGNSIEECLNNVNKARRALKI